MENKVNFFGDIEYKKSVLIKAGTFKVLMSKKSYNSFIKEVIKELKKMIT